MPSWSSAFSSTLPAPQWTHAAHALLGCWTHSTISRRANGDRPVAKPRDLDESVQRRRVAAPLHSQQPHLPRNRVPFERNGLERRKARHVLGREYHAEASRGHVLQVQVVIAAVAEAGRFLGEIRPLDLRGDVASGAFQQDGLAEVVDADRGTVCEPVCRRENRDVALLEQQPVVDAGGHVLYVPDHCGVDLPLKQEVDELLRCALAQLDAKSRDELCDLRDRIEDERRRDRGGEADLQWRDLLALELLGSATRRLYRGQCARQHRKNFLPKVGELRQLALAVDQLAAELLLELLHPLGQGGLRNIALLGCAGEVECGRDGEEVASLMKVHGVFLRSTRRRDGHAAMMGRRWNLHAHVETARSIKFGRTDTLSGTSKSPATELFQAIHSSPFLWRGPAGGWSSRRCAGRAAKNCALSRPAYRAGGQFSALKQSVTCT